MHNTRIQSTAFCVFKLLTVYSPLNRVLGTPFNEKILSEEKKVFLYWDLQLSTTTGNYFQNPGSLGRENLPPLTTVRENRPYSYLYVNLNEKQQNTLKLWKCFKVRRMTLELNAQEKENMFKNNHIVKYLN